MSYAEILAHPDYGEYTAHPAADMFPLMDEEQFAALAADIRANGQLEAVEVVGAEILDGRNRYLAARAAGKEPRVVRWCNAADPWAYVVSRNLRRRHLTREQRDEVIAKLRERGMSVREIAKAAGVPKSTVADGVRRLSESGQLSQPGVVEGRDGRRRPATAPVQARNTGNSEWYTPKEHIAAAREVMGGIDLDPASCAEANAVVEASTWYGVEDDGLDPANEWKGRVWMNPPYSQPLCAMFCERLAREHAAGNVPQAVVLVNNATETEWFQSLARLAGSICYPAGRVKFWHPGKESSPLQGQAVLYLGPDAWRFADVFAALGEVVAPQRRDLEHLWAAAELAGAWKAEAAKVFEATEELRLARAANAERERLARENSSLRAKLKASATTSFGTSARPSGS